MFRFRIAILTLFSVVSIGLVSSVIAFQYWQTRSAVIDSAGHFMNEVAAKVRERTQGVFGQLRVMAESAVLLPSLSTAPTLHGHPTGPYLINALQSSRWAQAVFFGYQNGDFFGIIKFTPETDSSRQHIGAPFGAAFGMRIVSRVPDGDGRHWDLWNFLNRSHQIIDSRVTLDPAYNPSAGPWFRDAINQPVSVVTSRYH